MRILVTRPGDEGHTFAARLSDIGHVPVVSPALEIVPIDGPAIDTQPFAAVAISSANAVRALSQRTADRGAKIICVGAASAAAAASAGFMDIHSSAGEGVAGLVQTIGLTVKRDQGPILYPSAEDVAGDLERTLASQGYRVDRRILYRAVLANQLTPAAHAALSNGNIDAVTYFSARSVQGAVAAARTAKLFDTLKTLPAYCLSAAIAAEAEGSSASTIVARKATETAMLELLGQGKSS